MQQHLPAAIAWAEGEMKRSILARTHYWQLDEFPSSYNQAIYLPRGKTQSVKSIVYSSGGVLTTLRGPSSGSPIGIDYQENLAGDSGGVLMPPRGSWWPWTDYDVPVPVTITFVAGWTPQTVPADIKLALMTYIADALEMPGAADRTQYSDTNAKDILLSGWTIRCA